MEKSSGPSANLKRNEAIQWDRESGQIDQVSNSTMHLKSSPSSWNIFSKGHQSNDIKMVAGSVLITMWSRTLDVGTKVPLQVTVLMLHYPTEELIAVNGSREV